LPSLFVCPGGILGFSWLRHIAWSSQDKIVPVLHKFMAKHITQDPDNGQMLLVGTMVQSVCGVGGGRLTTPTDTVPHGVGGGQLTTPPETVLHGGPDTFRNEFNFRFNEKSSREEQIELRRRVPIPEFGERFTYNCSIPMVKQVIFGVPPYEIVELKVLIELSTGSHTYTKDGETTTCQVRPNLLINPYDERELFYIKDEKAFDMCDMMNLITAIPHVRVQYDKKKRYCPKYEATFYAETPMNFKFVTTICPLLLVTFLSLLNVLDPAGDQHGPDLENSIANALTVVFVLPALAPGGRDKVHRHGFGLNEVWIFLIYLGLFLTSVRLDKDHMWLVDPQQKHVEYDGSGVYGALLALVEGEPGNREGYLTRVDWIGYFGIGAMMFSFTIPMWNYYQYWRLKNHLKNTGKYKADTMAVKKALVESGTEQSSSPSASKKATKERDAFLMNKDFIRWEVLNEKTNQLKMDHMNKFMTDVSTFQAEPSSKGDAAPLDKGSAWTHEDSNGSIFLERGPDYKDFTHSDNN
jgi:hypothetical protein